MFVHFNTRDCKPLVLHSLLSNVVLVEQIDHDVMYIGPFIYTQFLD
jgi:hypothetical protein